MKLFLFVLLFPLFAFSEELSGTSWSLSQAGCRDSSLSYSSHRSRPRLPGISNGIITFNDAKNFTIEHVVNRRKRTQQGTYSISGDRVDLKAQNRKEELELYIREDDDGNDTLIIVSKGSESRDNNCCPRRIIEAIEGGTYDNWKEWKRDIEAEGKETWEEHKKKNNLDIDEEYTPASMEELSELKNKCREEYPFVEVLRKI